MPISCHFRDCKALLVTSLTHGSGAIDLYLYGTVSQVTTHRWYCGRRRRNVYDKKLQRYAKDNRTAHLTARSDNM